MMKDRLALLIAGLLCAIGSWAFWHYIGADATNIIGTIFIVSLAVDNRRLRTRLRQHDLPPRE